ncbi:MAG: hypothetical protein ABIR13_01985 [Polaromonas sp.]
MKKYSNGVMARLPALLVMGSLTMAMQVSAAQTQPLDVGEDSAVREQPASSAAAKNSQSQASESLAPSNSAVKAPPRPIASDKVVIGVGLNPVELKRQHKAHSADKIVKKDPTRDDSIDAPPSPPKKIKNAIN